MIELTPAEQDLVRQNVDGGISSGGMVVVSDIARRCEDAILEDRAQEQLASSLLDLQAGRSAPANQLLGRLSDRIDEAEANLKSRKDNPT